MKNWFIVAIFVSLVASASFVNSQSEQATEPEIQDARLYTGWAVVQRTALDPEADPEEYIQMRGIEIWDNGEIINIEADGEETGYSFELIVLPYSEEITVLKLAVIDNETGESPCYVWGEPGAKRLGINVRWVQVGLTLKEME